MSTIVLIGATVALGIATVLWHHTRSELRIFRRELRTMQQEVQIQRRLLKGEDDDSDDPPHHGRHLRALALLAPIVLWFREHPFPAAAVSTAAVGTVAAVTILAHTDAPPERPQPPRAAPGEPLTTPSRSPALPDTSTSTVTVTPQSGPMQSADPGVPDVAAEPTTPASTVTLTLPALTTTVTITTVTITNTPIVPPGSSPAGDPLLCAELALEPAVDIGACLLGTQLVTITDPDG